ncbi:DUF6290 family protein [Campylobacter mucosalis]|uniref:DUF6290 family protein n=1 Tax=Campylobacter mucosalis TaxID=202 RepID=UPI00146FE1E2|nr:DUF6290 family protein [Campylobacter mucosalis]
MDVALNLSKDMQNLLLNYAKEKNTTAQNVIEGAVIEFLEELQDMKKAEDEYSKYIKSDKKGISAKELYKELGL